MNFRMIHSPDHPCGMTANVTAAPKVSVFAPMKELVKGGDA
jgi:hypothetical protein